MKKIEALKEQVKTQCSNGNWNYDPYMHGLANGLILALSTIEDVEPMFLSAPEVWLSDKLSKGDLFLKHIHSHLKPGQHILCKICGKTVDEIANTPMHATAKA